MSEYSQLMQEKTDCFALRIVRLYNYLTNTSPKKEYVMSKQLLRSGTSIGANLNEGIYAQSQNDLISKSSIALKECSESLYWLRLLHKSEYLTDREYVSLHADAEEILKILITSVKSLKKTKEKGQNQITDRNKSKD